MGITVGLGQYYLATTTLLLVLFALFILDKVEIRSGHYGRISLEGEGGEALYEETRKRLAELGFSIKGCRIEAKPRDGYSRLNFTVRFNGTRSASGVVEALSSIKGIRAVSWRE